MQNKMKITPIPIPIHITQNSSLFRWLSSTVFIDNLNFFFGMYFPQVSHFVGFVAHFIKLTI